MIGTIPALLLALAPLAPAADGGRPPNIVLVVVDDLGWSDAGCCGSRYYETPHIDALRARGMRFTQAYAACAVCSPTRASILTGRYPARIGITDWIHHASPESRAQVAAERYLGGFDAPRGRPLLTPVNKAFLEHEEITLAELLAPRGTVSCAIGKWHLGPKGWLPTDQGFAFNLGGFQVGSPPSYFDPFASKRFPKGILGLEPRRKGEYLTDREADEAVTFIERHREHPFFLYMAHYAVHAPLQAKPELIAKYRAKPKTNHKVPVYAAMVQSVDEAVGRIQACLERHHLVENTLFIFTSDNGGAVHFPATSNAPLRAGKGYPYEGGLRIPFIAAWPGHIPPASTCEVPICTIDILPTLAAASGAKLPAGRIIDGLDLGPLLAGTGEIERNTLVWHFPHYWWGTRIKPYSIIRRGDLKLIRFYEEHRFELYDLRADPGEHMDLAAQRPRVVKRLDARLSAILTAQRARLPRPNPDFKR